MAAAAATAGAASAAAASATSQDPMNALCSAVLRHSAPHWSAAAAAAAASFFSPPFRPRRCRFRRAPAPVAAARTPRSRASSKARVKLLMEAEPRDPWLASLSLLPADDNSGAADASPIGWAIGVDPDTGGAIAVLSPDGSSQVFDNPFVHIVVSEVIRKRLDTKSIIQLLRGLEAPPGTTAYIEKSSPFPFPTDGKLGWWSTGFRMACGLLLWWHLGFQLFRLLRKHGRLTLGYLEVNHQRMIADKLHRSCSRIRLYP